MPEIEVLKRKINEFSLLITIPKPWATKHGIQPHDEISLSAMISGFSTPGMRGSTMRKSLGLSVSDEKNGDVRVKWT